MKKILVFLVFIAFLYTLLCSCSTTSGSIAGYMTESVERIEAVEFPELILIDSTGRTREVKILSLQGRMVTVSPFPYWLLEPEEIPLNQIRSLKFKRHSYPGLTFTMVYAEAGFIIAGGALGARAESSGQYALALGLGIVGAVVGIGAAFFSNADVWELGEEMYPEYDLSVMSEPDKLLTVTKIMGVL